MAKQSVYADMDSYLAGADADDWKGAPVMSDWQPLAVGGRLTIEGRREGGERVTTREVVWIDRDFRWFRTIGELYRLGEFEVEIPMELELDDREGS